MRAFTGAIQGDNVRAQITLLTSVALGGCATTSFSPPPVDMARAMTAGEGILDKCVVVPKRLDGDDSGRGIPITETVDGARNLIDNFVHNYRCRANAAADGRQVTDIPAFLALAGSSAAVAFGAGPNVAIAGGVANGVFTNAGKYWSAQQKTEILNHALDALLCIKTEAVGIDAFTLRAIAAVETTAGAPAPAAIGDDAPSDPDIAVTSVQQYFDMISASLMAVERIAAQRLSIVGTPFDAAGVVAEIEALSKKTEDAAGETGAALAQAASIQASPVDSTKMALQAHSAVTAIPKTQIAETFLKLKVMQPKLQQCVVRAKV